MKKFVVLIATVCMAFACMVVSASAVSIPKEFGDIHPDRDLGGNPVYDYIFMQYGDNYGLFILTGPYGVEQPDNPRFAYAGNKFTVQAVNANELSVYQYEYYEGHLEFWGSASVSSVFVPTNGYLASKYDILDSRTGQLVYETPPIELPSGVGEPVLPDAVPPSSLTGALSEVTSLLIWVIPVVIGLFAIRKGIAFLFARFRGV